MIKQSNKNIVNIPEVLLIISLMVITQFVLLKYFASPLLLVAITGCIFLWLINIITSRDTILFFIFINLAPLLYFNVSLHYLLPNIIMQDLPLLAIVLLGIYRYLQAENSASLIDGNLSKPILLLLSYHVFMAVFGYVRGNQTIFIVDEFYHYLYYPFGLLLSFVFVKKEHYKMLLSAMMIYSVLISFQNLYLNLFGDVLRWVTFQSYIIPITFGIVVSLFIFWKERRLITGGLSFILTIGMVVTLTRTLWVTIFITLGIIAFYYLVFEKGYNKRTIIILFTILSLPIVALFVSKMNQLERGKQELYDVEYRTESLMNPSADVSFLMRVELGLYITERVIANPIIGEGLGSSVQYKYLGITNVPINYPDNSWLYFLWKGGIIGLLLYTWVYYSLLRVLYKIFKHSPDLATRYISLGILAGLVGLAALGLFNAVLIKYKTNIFLSFVIAYANYESKKIDNDQKTIA